MCCKFILFPVINFLHHHPHVVWQPLVRDFLARLFQVGKFIPRKVDGQRRVFLDVPLDATVLLILVQTDRFALLGGDFDFAENLFFGVELLECAVFGLDNRNVEPVLDVLFHILIIRFPYYSLSACSSVTAD